jgi:ribosomal protein S18 acetylase RimI-like enzyme
MRWFSQSTVTNSNNERNAYEGSILNNNAHEETCCSGDASASTIEETEECAHDEKLLQHRISVNGHHRRLGRGIIFFRPVKPEDRQVIQTLHEQWFPVDYKSDFFDGLCNDRIMPGTTQPLYSCVACFRELDDSEFEEMYEKRERESCSMSFFWPKEKNLLTSKYYCNETNDECVFWKGRLDDEYDDDSGLPCSGTIQYDNTISTIINENTDDFVSTEKDECRKRPVNQVNEREKMKKFYSNGFRFDDCDGFNQISTITQNNSYQTSYNNSNGRKDDDCNFFVNDCGEVIAGCIVGSFVPSSMYSAKTDARDETATLLVPDPVQYPDMFYIMTLGTSREFRRAGLGSMLVNRVVDMIKSQQECGALYLHVITYNEGAIKLYERLGFSRVKRINGERTSVIYFE